jgi:hypothetical protein
MADQELVNYPGGQVQMGSGDLQHATAARFSFDNGAKLQHTLRKNAAGYTIGVHEATGDVETIVPQDGPEREFLQKAIKGEPVQLRYKAPGLTATFEGIIKTGSIDMATGEAVKLNISIIGKLTIV